MDQADKHRVTSDSSPVVLMDNVNMHYGKWHALRDVSLSVQAGEIVGLLGHNGAGKTTTIRLLNGLLKPTGGSIRVFGVDPLTGGAAFRSKTSVVNDTLGLPERQTARQALAFHVQLFGLEPLEAAADGDELLVRFGLGSAADTVVKNYSRGMRQRLALARSMLHKPKLLLLDEPTLGMDPVGRKEFREILKTLTATGTAVLMSTHDLGEVERACDNMVILHQGRVILDGTPDQTVKSVGGSKVSVDFVGATNLDVSDLNLISDISDVALDGREITFTAADESAIADAVRFLINTGVSVVGVRTHKPTLEDVYVAMHGSDRV